MVFSSDGDGRQVIWPTLAQDAGRLPTLSTRLERHRRRGRSAFTSVLSEVTISTACGGFIGGLVGSVLPLVTAAPIGFAATMVLPRAQSMWQQLGLAAVVGVAGSALLLTSSTIWTTMALGTKVGAAMGLWYGINGRRWTV